jgi:hypothetical protein
MEKDRVTLKLHMLKPGKHCDKSFRSVPAGAEAWRIRSLALALALILRYAARFDTMLDGHEAGNEVGNKNK